MQEKEVECIPEPCQEEELDKSSKEKFDMSNVANREWEKAFQYHKKLRKMMFKKQAAHNRRRG